MFSIFKKKDFFTPEEKQLITEAIRHAEQMTSGEVRVFVESKCSYMDAIDRAAELFFGDEGIHKKVGNEYWSAEVKKMIANFNRKNYAEGISEVVKDIGEALTKHFPYNNESDKNELPDDIVFGK